MFDRIVRGVKVVCERRELGCNSIDLLDEGEDTVFFSQAAHRELIEETGLPGDLIKLAPVEIARKTDLRPAGLRPDESDNFLGYRWFSR